MAKWVQVETCPIKGCGSPVFAEIVPPHRQPRIRFSCRCPVVYPDRFKVAGELGYRVSKRKSIRRN